MISRWSRVRDRWRRLRNEKSGFEAGSRSARRWWPSLRAPWCRWKRLLEPDRDLQADTSGFQACIYRTETPSWCIFLCFFTKNRTFLVLSKFLSSSGTLDLLCLHFSKPRNRQNQLIKGIVQGEQEIQVFPVRWLVLANSRR